MHTRKLTTVPKIWIGQRQEIQKGSLISVNRIRADGKRKNIINDFANNTSIHGVKYLNGSTHKNKIHKFLWTFIMIFSFANCFLLVNKIWAKYCQNDMQTLLSGCTMYGKDFPSVTFCPQRPMMEEKIEKIVKRMILPSGVRASKLRHNMRHYYQFLAQKEVDDATISEMIGILKMNNMTMKDVINDLIDPCESFLHSCYFEEERISCRHYFKGVMAARRYCCTFNSIYFDNGNSNYKVKKSFGYGPRSGLILRFNENRFGSTIIDDNEIERNISNENEITIYVVNSYESLTSVLVGSAIQHGKELHIQLDLPRKYLKNGIQNYCVDEEVEERPYVPFYTVLNCILSGKIQKALQYCNCIPYFYANGLVNHSKKICDIENTICLNVNFNNTWREKKKLRYDYNSACPATCKIILIRKTTTEIPINEGDFACSSLYENITNRGAVLRVYLKTEITERYRQKNINSKVDYFAYLGGIFSLCLGCSVISIFEVFHFIGLLIRHFFTNRTSD